MDSDKKPHPAREMTRLEAGRQQMVDAVGGGNENLYVRLVQDTGIYGLSAFIADVLDLRYPPAVFGDGRAISVDSGAIEPGIMWVALLRRAVDEVER